MPVSTSTRPPGVSMSRQLSAWMRLLSAVSSSATSRSHMKRGTGPKMVPASEWNVPAWTSATRTPPPSSVRQSTFAVMPIGQPGRRRGPPLVVRRTPKSR